MTQHEALAWLQKRYPYGKWSVEVELRIGARPKEIKFIWLNSHIVAADYSESKVGDYSTVVAMVPPQPDSFVGFDQIEAIA